MLFWIASLAAAAAVAGAADRREPALIQSSSSSTIPAMQRTLVTIEDGHLAPCDERAYPTS